MAFFTETFTEITGLTFDDTWRTVDLTSYSVPDGAVVAILCTHTNDAADRTLGVRAVGSSLERKLILHEGEGGGDVSVMMHVQADSSGQIQYLGNSTDCHFYLLGYYGTGISYTELFGNANYSIDSPNVWYAKTLNGGVANKVFEIACYNNQTGSSRSVGIREVGSSLVRTIDIHEAEAAVIGYTYYTSYVKTNASSQAELYNNAGSGTINHWISLGYFSSNVDFIEKFDALTMSSDDTWTVQSAVAGYANRVAMIACVHQDTGAEEHLGASSGGGASTRYHLEHEAESNGFTGATYPTLVNASDQFYTFAGDASEGGFKNLGYLYQSSVVVQETITDGIKAGESLARISIFRKTILDGIKGSESQARIGTFPRTSIDGAKFTETLIRGLLLSNAVTDGVKLSETLYRVLSVLATSTDAAKISDTTAQIIQAVATSADGIKATESVAALLIALCQSADGIKIAESLAAALSAQMSVSDTVKVTEAVARGMMLTNAAEDALKLSENIARILNVRVSAADGAELIEPLSPQTAYASSLTITVGSVESGALSDTYAVDTTYLKLNEITGAPPTMDYTFDFTGIRGTPERVVFRGRYTGNSGHVVMMQAWDNVGSAWVDLVRIVHSASADSTYIASILDPKYVAAEIVKIRFYHSTAGINTHDLYVDQIYCTYNFGIDAMLIARSSATDALKIAESIAGSLGMNVTASDGLSLSEALSGAINALVESADGITLTDDAIQALSTAIQGIIADGFTLSEIAAASAQMRQSIDDGLSLSEILTSAEIMRNTVSDGAKISEIVARVITAVATVSDGLSISDAASRILRAIESASDGFTLTEEIVESVRSAYQELIDDGFKLSEVVAATNYIVGSITSGVKLSDVAARVATIPGVSADIFKISEAVTRIIRAVLTATDGFNLAESVIGSASISLTILDGIRIDESVAGPLTIRATATDGTSLSDLLALAAAFAPSISDGFRFSESLQADLGGLFDEIVADGFKTSESLSTAAQFIRAITDKTNLSEALAGILAGYRTASDALTASDATARIARMIGAATDSVLIAETVARSMSITGTAVDAVTVGEIIQAALQARATATDGAVIAETVARKLSAAGNVVDALLVGEILQRSAQIAVTGSDGFFLSDATIGEIILTIIQALAADGLTAGDSTSATAQFDITVSDGAKFSETISTIMQFLAAVADGFKSADSTREGEEFIPRGKVHVDFSSRAASIIFTSINGGKIIFTVRRPEIGFTIN